MNGSSSRQAVRTLIFCRMWGDDSFLIVFTRFLVFVSLRWLCKFIVHNISLLNFWLLTLNSLCKSIYKVTTCSTPRDRQYMQGMTWTWFVQVMVESFPLYSRKFEISIKQSLKRNNSAILAVTRKEVNTHSSARSLARSLPHSPRQVSKLLCFWRSLAHMVYFENLVSIPAVRDKSTEERCLLCWVFCPGEVFAGPTNVILHVTVILYLNTDRNYIRMYLNICFMYLILTAGVP